LGFAQLQIEVDAELLNPYDVLIGPAEEGPYFATPQVRWDVLQAEVVEIGCCLHLVGTVVKTGTEARVGPILNLA
jgi:hypothetical protein